MRIHRIPHTVVYYICTYSEYVHLDTYIYPYVWENGIFSDTEEWTTYMNWSALIWTEGPCTLSDTPVFLPVKVSLPSFPAEVRVLESGGGPGGILRSKKSSENDVPTPDRTACSQEMQIILALHYIFLYFSFIFTTFSLFHSSPSPYPPPLSV
jgi:hypothetical protein